MKILVVDDNPIKANTIVKSIQGARPDAEVDLFTYGRDALMELMVEDYDYLVTDMEYRWSDSSNLDSYCGIKLLSEMNESAIATKTIVCSSERTDVDSFDQVVGYIVYQGHDMSEKFGRILR